MTTNTDRRGFTIIEMVMAIVLMGLVGGVIHGMLTATKRAHQRQVQLASVNFTIRSASSILESALIEVNARDSLGSDILTMTPTSMTLKSSRNLYFLCQPPDVTNSGVWVAQQPSFGQAGFAGLDSLFLFFDGDPFIRADDRWLHAGVASVTAGNSCPGSTPSLFIALGGVTSTQLDSIYTGAPVRGFDIVELSLYVQSGERWLGSRRFTGGSWTSPELLTGPMDAGGLIFSVFDEAGNPVATPTQAARVSISLTGRTTAPVSVGTGVREFATADLTTEVSLRNNPRY